MMVAGIIPCRTRVAEMLVGVNDLATHVNRVVEKSFGLSDKIKAFAISFRPRECVERAESGHELAIRFAEQAGTYDLYDPNGAEIKRETNPGELVQRLFELTYGDIKPKCAKLHIKSFTTENDVYEMNLKDEVYVECMLAQKKLMLDTYQKANEEMLWGGGISMMKKSRIQSKRGAFILILVQIF